MGWKANGEVFLMGENMKTDNEHSAVEAEEITKEPMLQPMQRIVIRVPARHNPRLQQVIDRVNADDELYTLWQVNNVNAVQRLAMNDHGPVHVQIVTNIALKLLRLLVDRSVTPSVVEGHNLTIEDAEVIVVLASLLHDIGMSIQRTDHELFSLFLARPKIKGTTRRDL